jgi:short-subunit dehydrogenase
MKTIAITGASSGIGRATALRFARSGHAIALAARRLDRLEAVANEIRRAGGQALPIAADVTREADMQSLVERSLEHFGRLDVLVCNAGYGLYGAIDQIPPARMRQIHEVNYMGTWHAISAALPVFRRQGTGHIVVVSSIVGRRGVPYMGAYSATKFAQVGLAECLRAELRGTGIHVTVVYPISTETEFFQVMTAESGFATRASGPRQPPEDVAEAIHRAVARPVPEVYPYRKAKWLAVIAAVAPSFADGLVQKWGRKPIRAAE